MNYKAILNWICLITASAIAIPLGIHFGDSSAKVAFYIIVLFAVVLALSYSATRMLEWAVISIIKGVKRRESSKP